MNMSNLQGVSPAVGFCGTKKTEGCPKQNPNASSVFADKADSFDTTVEKPKALESFGKGILTNLKLMIPFYGTYTIGKEYLEQENTINDLNNLKAGKEAESKKPGVLKSILVGTGIGLAQAVPFLGSYLIGHQQIEQDNAIRELNGEATKNDGVLASIGKGFLTKLGCCIPLLATYIKGQEFAEQDKLVDKVNELKAQVAYNA